ncbi:MAG: substrate-binding domain-containing protein [Acidobacteriota bacterium]|nr:substrate-binding domain-containing protein [Acidobacteriota bacterium]
MSDLQLIYGVGRFAMRLACLVAAVFVVTNCGAETGPPVQELSGTIRIVGTDTMKELMGRWINSFTAFHLGVHIELAADGALTAAPALADGSADLAPLGREFTPAELTSFRVNRPYDPTGIPVALGSYDISGRTVALALFVNRSNPIGQLTFQQLDAIYCDTLLQGSTRPITTWGQLGLTGDWTAKPINPIGVNFPDGISNFIRLRICKGGQLRTDIRTEHTGGPVNVLDRIVTDVVDDSTAIGYAGFANLKPGAKLIRISEEGGHYLSGNRDEVASAQYPLTRFIYIYVDRKPSETFPPLERAFLSFILSSQGQALVGTDGIFMPLPPPIAAHAQKEIR